MIATAFGLAPSFRLRISGTALAADVARAITDVSVTSRPQTLDECSFTLTNAYPAMRWTHTTDANLFEVGASVQVDLGYADAMEQVFDGEITSVAADFPEGGAPTVRLTARSRLFWLALGTRTRTFQDATDSEIVQEVAQGAGLSARADTTTVRHPYVLQYNQTDLQFLLDRAARLRFEVLAEGRELIFRAAPQDDRPVVSLEWGRTLRSFRPALEPTRQASEVTVRGYDPANKEPIVGTAGPSDQDTRMGGSQSGADVLSGRFGREAPDVEVTPPPGSQEEADGRAAARFNEIAQDTVTGEGSCVGLPDLRAGRVVELTGLGPRFSGSYYITQATHSLGSGGYTTSFSVGRPAIG
jgi:phage protein D